MGWISVEDRLPRQGDEVIVYIDGVVDSDWIDICIDSGNLFLANYHDKATHWMPLPEPPKDK